MYSMQWYSENHTLHARWAMTLTGLSAVGARVHCGGIGAREFLNTSPRQVFASARDDACGSDVKSRVRRNATHLPCLVFLASHTLFNGWFPLQYFSVNISKENLTEDASNSLSVPYFQKNLELGKYKEEEIRQCGKTNAAMAC